MMPDERGIMYPSFNPGLNSYNPQFNQFNAQMAQQRLAQMQPMAQQNELQFVNGIDSVNAFPMGPNETRLFMDRNMARFYIKETDAAAVANVSAFDFTPAKADKPQDYVTRAEFEELRSQYESIAQKFSAQPAQLSGFGLDDAGDDPGQG